MDDLVIRLRDINVIRRDGLFNICDEAADEIEKLRLQVQQEIHNGQYEISMQNQRMEKATEYLKATLRQAREALKSCHGFVVSDYEGVAGRDYSNGAIKQGDEALAAIDAVLSGAPVKEE